MSVSPLGLDIVHWETWTVPMVGMASAGLMVFIGLRRPKHASPPPPPASVSAAGQLSSRKGRTTERRLSVRRGGNPVKVFILDTDATTEPIVGWVCDRSRGGLCLRVGRRTEVGVMLSVRTADPFGTPWIPVVVRTCRPQGGHWDLGCQFVRLPPYSQLLLFG